MNLRTTCGRQAWPDDAPVEAQRWSLPWPPLLAFVGATTLAGLTATPGEFGPDAAAWVTAAGFAALWLVAALRRQSLTGSWHHVRAALDREAP